MGFNFLAIVFATLKEGDKKAVSAFEEAVEEIPRSCWPSGCLAIRTT
jgi:hypothetical protein